MCAGRAFWSIDDGSVVSWLSFEGMGRALGGVVGGEACWRELERMGGDFGFWILRNLRDADCFFSMISTTLKGYEVVMIHWYSAGCSLTS